MIYILLSAGIIVADQLMKSWVISNVPQGSQSILLPGLIRMTHVENTGAAFSQLQGLLPVIIVITALFCLAALLGLILKPIKSVFGNMALAMVLGGALGNFLDRIEKGYVVDMFDIIFMKFAVFNIADIFITCGSVLFCIYVLFAGRQSSGRGQRALSANGFTAAETEDGICADVYTQIGETGAGQGRDEIEFENMRTQAADNGKEKDYDPGDSGA